MGKRYHYDKYGRYRGFSTEKRPYDWGDLIFHFALWFAGLFVISLCFRACGY